MNIKNVLLLCCLFGFLCMSCQSGKSGVKDLSAVPGVYVLDEPVSLEAYFDSIQRIDKPPYTYADNDTVVTIAIRELVDYAAGDRADYPASEVQQALRGMGRGLAYQEAHAGESTRVFFYRFLEQAARLCPDVALLSDVVSSEGRIGILAFDDWSELYSLFSFLLYRGDVGCKVRMIGDEGTGIREVHCLRDKGGHTYYLCSNNDCSMLTFCQYLYLSSNGELVQVCSQQGFSEDLNWDKVSGNVLSVDFHPEDLTWTCAGGDASCGVLRLILAGKKSHFMMK